MKAKMGAQANPNDLPKMGQLILMIDKEVPYQMLQEVMFTAGQASFNEFQFVVIGPMEWKMLGTFSVFYSHKDKYSPVLTHQQKGM